MSAARDRSAVDNGWYCLILRTAKRAERVTRRLMAPSCSRSTTRAWNTLTAKDGRTQGGARSTTSLAAVGVSRAESISPKCQSTQDEAPERRAMLLGGSIQSSVRARGQSVEGRGGKLARHSLDRSMQLRLTCHEVGPSEVPGCSGAGNKSTVSRSVDAVPCARPPRSRMNSSAQLAEACRIRVARSLSVHPFRA